MKNKRQLLLAFCAVNTFLATARPAFVPSLVSPRQLKSQPLLTRASTVVSKEPYIADIAGERTDTKPEEPLLEVKMEKLKLPMLAVGKEPVTIPLKIQEEGPFEFMVDTGLTAQIISPRLKDLLKIDKQQNKEPANIAKGLAAGGSTGNVKLVKLSGVSLYNHEKDLDLPTLRAVVTNFVQENMDRRHSVKGMLGMEMLELFDVDLDFPAGRVRFWAPGTAAKEARRLGMVEIPTRVINESLLLGTRITGKLPNTKDEPESKAKQPFLGIIDSGSTFSAVNWKAAQLLGLPPQNSLQYLKPPAIMAVGVDGKPLYLPTKKMEFTFCGDAIASDKDDLIVGFASPPPEWKPWKPVLTGIGDLPIFELLLGTDKTPFQGPAAIIGMDVLSQRRVILESCSRDDASGSHTRGRSRRMFISPE